VFVQWGLGSSLSWCVIPGVNTETNMALGATVASACTPSRGLCRSTTVQALLLLLLLFFGGGLRLRNDPHITLMMCHYSAAARRCAKPCMKTQRCSPPEGPPST
jgi:hypothetical protein